MLRFIAMFLGVIVVFETANAQQFQSLRKTLAPLISECVVSKNDREVVLSYVYHLANAKLETCGARGYVLDREIGSYISKIERKASEKAMKNPSIYLACSKMHRSISRLKVARRKAAHSKGGFDGSCYDDDDGKCIVITKGDNLFLRVLPHIDQIPSLDNRSTVRDSFQKGERVTKVYSFGYWSYVQGLGYSTGKRRHGWASNDHLECR